MTDVSSYRLDIAGFGAGGDSKNLPQIQGMKNIRIIFIAALLLLSHAVQAQIKMLPREKVDSLAAARRTEWCDDRVVFDSLTIHTPQVHQKDAPIVAAFRFRNVGPAALTLEKVETSCSCVRAALSAQVVEPGEECVVDVVYLQRGHPGRHDRYIYIYLEGEKPLALLTLCSDVLD
ncbi:MAG: DUF1573 domain-containing protein [Bacteroidales bacterium]|nr:DUF1573 domain-containing protein [Bacteroidales bacterium]